MEDNGKILYVRSQEQFENPEAFEVIKEDEFPHRSSMLDINRRDLLKFAGGTLAMAGLAQGCRYLPQQKIVPFVQAPEDRLPGHESVYATAASIGGFATGLLVRQYEGRPVKLEGNPGHPSSLGGISPQIQAELAVMFDPDRIKDVRLGGDVATWNEFYKVARSAMSSASAGSGIAILTQNVNSPTLAVQINTFLKKNPSARWFQYEPANRDSAHEGAKMAFGQPVDSVYHFDKADVIVTLDSDFFQSSPGHLAYMRDAMKRRDVGQGQTTMNRIYSFESFPTLVGSVADHRYRVKASQIQSVAMSLAAALGVEGASDVPNSGVSAKVIQGLAADLKSANGRSVVVAGDHQPAQVHALVHAINHAIGAFGNTVKIIEPVAELPANNTADIKALVAAMKEGQVEFLFIIGGNPVWDAPADLQFGEALAKVKLSAHLSLYDNETSKSCNYQLAESHFLEAWGDARGHDGSASVVQPLISPMYETMSAIEVLEHLNGKMRPEMEIVQSTWAAIANVAPGTGFEDEWNQWLSTGIISNSAKPVLSLQPVPNLASAISAPKASELEVVVVPDPTIYDGRYANIGWMQELPKPLTNITWDNAFHMSPATAKKYRVGQETQKLGVQYYGNWDIVKVTANGKTVEGPVYIFNGMADDVILVHTGYGRQIENLTVAQKGDPIRVGGGFDAYPLRTAENSWISGGASIEKTGANYKLANTQFHNLLDVTEIDSKRDIIRETTLAEYIKHSEVLQHPTTETMEKEGEEPGTVSIFPGTEGYNSPDQYQWAMTIDLNLCTGCGSCVTACQAENNIPTVGKEQTLRHRMLHWIRVDRYYRAEQGKAFDENEPVITFQPVTCMHCEKAPCEPVCPVAATTHSHEGINQMVYNRCVGTRYCSNNCPYKVRRFNYLHYTKKVEDVPVLKLLQNPDVTVRGRGVMEKCTYCVHRINHARIEAKKADKEIKDGAVVTACQQACPTQAIVFGDMRRPQNAVSKTRASNRNYTLLKNLNTRPRTTYLGKVRNPNPEMGA